MSEIYTALLIILAVHNGGIEKSREVPFQSLQECQVALDKLNQEPDPEGYTFVAQCIAAGGQKTEISSDERLTIRPNLLASSTI